MLTGFRTPLTVRLVPLAALLAFAVLAGARADEPADPPGRVARVNLALGAVSMQPAGSESWVTDVLNRPMTNGDRLWADRESRAEMHIGSAAVRLGSETGIEILNIDDRAVQLKLSAGTLQVRVRALGPEQTFEIATPGASVAVLVPGDYRIMVGEGNGPLQIAVAQGQVAVTDQGHEATVGTGQLAEYTGDSVEDARISALPPGDAFDQWVADRDRREDRSEATQYVSREVTGYEDLDDYGSWRTAEEYGPVWVPAVSVGWAPYRYGHWGWIAPWGWTWIDDAPWGFAPFHYGRWVYYGSRWCWAPGPRRYAPVYAPALVGWVGGPHWSVGVGVGVPPVGWFPLGWNEVYVPSYRVSSNYVRTVNMTNTHVTNTTINNYITNNTTIVNGPNGRKTNGDSELGGQKYANFAVPGAVTATSRVAFTSAQPVATHLTNLPHEDLATAPIGTGAPAIPPTARSLGRPAATAPHAAPGLWSRPVVARTAPPPPPPSFEAQRHAVIANGGLPVPAGRLASPPVSRPGATPPTAAARADVIRVGPPAAMRAGTAPAAHPTAASPATQGARREAGGPERADRTTTGRPVAPASPAAPAATHSAPATMPPARPPAADFRPPTPPHQTAPQPVPRPAYDYRPPAQPSEAPPQSPPRPATGYRPPTQPREVAPQPPPRQTPDYRPPATPHEVAPQASPRPAQEYRPPAPPRETPPRPAQEYRPAAPHEAAPAAPRDSHAPPPAPHEAHPSAPPAESAPRGPPHDKR